MRRLSITPDSPILALRWPWQKRFGGSRAARAAVAVAIAVAVGECGVNRPPSVWVENRSDRAATFFVDDLGSDATPYYFFGLRSQVYFPRRFKLELWLVNGWQTFGQWQEGRAGGFLWNWRPSERFSLSSTVYGGRTYSRS